MMDAGQDAGFSQGVADSDHGKSGPRYQVPINGTAARDRQTDTILPEPDEVRSSASQLTTLPAGFDMAALQVLAGQMRNVQPGSEAGGAGGAEQAMTIARQVADMAQGLAALADRLVGQGAATPAESIDVAEADCVAFLESQFRIRRLRARHLPALSLGEPAWDILLDLAVAQYWRRETSVTSLCIAADVPSTTALRWINSMTREGLIVRRPCQRDGRRSFLAIAPETYQAMLAMAADSLRTEQRVRTRYQRG
jgi:DNA-binding MarR family transcriptional regulator